MSHAFTGCDYVEAFHGKGKKSWLTAYQKTEKLWTLFARLSSRPQTLVEADMDLIARFVLKIYKAQATPNHDVAAGRYDVLMSSKSLKCKADLSPTRDALVLL